MTKLSIIIPTYNHGKFIAQTIEGCLMQQTNFDFELLIGDDASTDDNALIISEYQAKFPNKIKAFLHKENLGPAQPRELGGKNNVAFLFKQAKSQYIALCEGDDYWTDPLKLQKQVDFLDKNLDFVACFHNAEIIYDDDSHPNMFVNQPDQKVVTTVEDLIGEDEVWFMATSAVVFRNGIIKEYPKWFHESKSGDIPRYILLGKNGGKFMYLNETMSVYRKNRNSGMSFTDGYKDANFLWNRINMYRGIDEELSYQFHETLNKNIARYYRMLIESKQYRNSFFKKVSLFNEYKNLAKPDFSTIKDIWIHSILPKGFQKLYSFIALLPHKIKGS